MNEVSPGAAVANARRAEAAARGVVGVVAILLKAYDENDHQYSECVPRVYVRWARAA